MSYLVIENFVGGLDTRRNILTSKPGNLVKLDNCHITRGGEIERRKAFVHVGTLPAGTYGLEACGDTMFVFGSIPTPSGIPSGITYQRLIHPDGTSFSMTKVVSFTSYAGKPFVIVEFNDGARYCYYNGVLVNDSVNGIFRASHGSIQGFLQHLASLLPTGYTYTVSPTGMTVIGPPGVEFTMSVTTNGNLSASSPLTSVQSVKGIPEIRSSASFDITGGANGNGSVGKSMSINATTLPGITGIYVNGEDILQSANPVYFYTAPGGGETDAQRLSNSIAYMINQKTIDTGYFAAADNRRNRVMGAGGIVLGYTYYSSLTIYSDPLMGSEANGLMVVFEFEGHITNNNGLFTNIQISPFDTDPNDPNYVPVRHVGDFGAFAGAVDNSITEVRVDGVDILGAPVRWRSSNSSTAQAVVDQINSFTSVPDYTASAVDGGRISLKAAVGAGSSPNGRQTSATTIGNFTTGAFTAMSGGVNPIGGVSQRTTFSLSSTGSNNIGSTATITITDVENVVYPYYIGATPMGGLKLNFCLTYKSKVHILAGSYIISSGLDMPTVWKQGELGFSFIDLSNNTNGSQELVGASPYQGRLAIFTRESCQVWNIDPDPQNNSLSQIIMNTGTIAPNSVIGYGEIDVFYLSDSGIRSLRARDSSSQAMVHDVGVNIDTQAVELLRNIPESVAFNAFAVIEPKDNRIMMSIYDKIFVLSQYQTASISAWSTYTPEGVISKMAIMKGRVFSRQGDGIYLYGGTDGITYDNCVSDVILPYLDGTKPATMKHLLGIDLTSDGNWDFFIGTDPYAPDVRDHVATIYNSTFQLGRVPAVGVGTHIGVRLISIGSGYGRIGNLILHYELNESE